MKLCIVFYVYCVLLEFTKMVFNAEEFVSTFQDSPNVELISGLRKGDLLDVGKFLKLNVTSSMKKADIKKDVLHHYVLIGILSDSVLHEFEQKPSSEIEMKRLELEYKMKMKEMEIKGQLKLKELELEGKRMHEKEKSECYEIGRYIKLVPQFNESDIDKYFLHFEKVAETCKWPKDIWTMLLQSVLVGKAQEIYAALTLEQSSDYAVVKEAILKAYELVPEAYRQKFRYCKGKEGQTFVEYVRVKEILFNRWCSSQNVTSLDDFKQLILLEEFKRSIPLEIRSHLEEQHVSTLTQAAVMADDYTLTHPKRFNQKSSITRNVTESPPELFKSLKTSPKRAPQKDTKAYKFCNYCKMAGHVISECRKLEKKTRLKEKHLPQLVCQLIEMLVECLMVSNRLLQMDLFLSLLNVTQFQLKSYGTLVACSHFFLRMFFPLNTYLNKTPYWFVVLVATKTFLFMIYICNHKL